jgi:hypothetical protein
MAANTVYVQGPYVDVHDNEVVNLSVDKAGKVQVDSRQMSEDCVIPNVLAESELWQKLIDANLLDDNGQPTVSRPDAALMADMISVRLGISNKWKMFEKLWHRNNMRGDFNTALEQRKSLAFQEKLKNILG